MSIFSLLPFLKLQAGGVVWPSANGYTFSPDTNDGLREIYAKFLEITGALTPHGENVPTFLEFTGGYFLIPFLLR